MAGDTENAKQAAKEIVDHVNRGGLKRELVSTGVYEVVVEGGYHSQALTDQEADYICELIIDSGLEGLEEFARS